jgi:predicted enzyme related to lactoylglutathione lyase
MPGSGTTMDSMTQDFAPGAPNWIDLGTTDIGGAIAFYGPLFGWTHLDYGPEMGNYGMMLKDGKQVAGIGPATDPARGSSWSTYFATPDADAVAARVEANGGTVVMAPMDVMDQGRMAVFTDPAGTYFSVWQPGQHTGAEVIDEHGTLTWNELMSSDMATAKAFYPAVLGVSIRDVDMGDGNVYTLFEAGDRAASGGMAIDPAWGPMPSAWSVYFAVDDADAAFAKALELGGVSKGDPQDSPPGRFAKIQDPQGATFSILANDPDFVP